MTGAQDEHCSLNAAHILHFGSSLHSRFYILHSPSLNGFALAQCDSYLAISHRAFLSAYSLPTFLSGHDFFCGVHVENVLCIWLVYCTLNYNVWKFGQKMYPFTLLGDGRWEYLSGVNLKDYIHIFLLGWPSLFSSRLRSQVSNHTAMDSNYTFMTAESRDKVKHRIESIAITIRDVAGRQLLYNVLYFIQLHNLGFTWHWMPGMDKNFGSIQNERTFPRLGRKTGT